MPKINPQYLIDIPEFKYSFLSKHLENNAKIGLKYKILLTLFFQAQIFH